MEEKNTTKKPISKKKLAIIICSIVGVLFIAGIVAFYIYMNNKNSHLATNHIYVCDNPSNLSEFDKWLKEDMKIKFVPTYVVIQNGQIIGAFSGDISAYEFQQQLGTVLALGETYGGFQGHKLTDLDGNTILDTDLFNEKNDNILILEVSWFGCEDCEHQDANYTENIYKTYGVDHFYRYYIKSERNDVLNKYKNT